MPTETSPLALITDDSPPPQALRPSLTSTGGSTASAADLQISFSTSIARGNGAAILKASDGTVIEYFDMVASSAVSINGSTLVINPTKDLVPGSTYQLQLLPGAVKSPLGTGSAALSYFITVGNSTGQTLDGGVRTDLLYGGSGDDKLFGGKGNDVLHGGKGSDTARFSGNVGDYSVRFNADAGITVTDSRTGRDGSDELQDIEYLAFNDLTLPTSAFRNPLAVQKYEPADDSTGVALGASISLNFNASIQRGSGSIVLETSTGTVVETFDAATSSRLVISGSTLTLDPSADLALDTGYRLNFAPGSITNLSRLPYAGGTSYNFTSTAFSQVLQGGTAADVLRGGSGRDRILGGKGNDSLAGGLGNDELYGDEGTDTAVFSGNSYEYRISYDAGAARFTVADNVAGRDGTDTVFAIEYLAFDNATLSAAGFRDTSAPTLLATEPARGTINVAADANIRLSFSEPVQRGTGSIWLTTSDGAYVDSFNVTNSSAVSISGATVTINPSYDLSAGTSYLLQLQAGIFKDMVGLPYAGGVGLSFTTIRDSHLFQGGNNTDKLTGTGDNDRLYGGKGDDILTGGAGNDELHGDGNYDTAVFSGKAAEYIVSYDSTRSRYTVADTVADRDGSDRAYDVEFLRFMDRTDSIDRFVDRDPPRIQSFDPANGKKDVDVAADLRLIFNEAVQRGSVSIVLKTSGGTLVESFSVATSTRLTINGSTLSINPTADLVSGTSYVIDMPKGSILDLTGNAFAGSSSYSFSAANLGKTLNGTAGDDKLTGGDGDDWLNGGDGSDHLDSDARQRGNGADRMEGGPGDDFYYIDNAGDKLIETAGNGYDRVTTQIDFSLASLPEIEYLAGSGSFGLKLTGNSKANTLVGTIGDDTLFGGAGDDILTGGKGNDRIRGDSGSDTAKFSGSLAEYLVRYDAASNSFAVIDRVPDRDGTDTLVDVEFGGFSDGQRQLSLLVPDVVPTAVTTAATPAESPLIGLPHAAPAWLQMFSF